MAEGSKQYAVKTEEEANNRAITKARKLENSKGNGSIEELPLFRVFVMRFCSWFFCSVFVVALRLTAESLCKEEKNHGV